VVKVRAAQTVVGRGWIAELFQRVPIILNIITQLKIIVVTYPEPVNNEGQILNQLIEIVLDCLHVRKPELGIEET
jgi:hypothetical protein